MIYASHYVVMPECFYRASSLTVALDSRFRGNDIGVHQNGNRSNMINQKGVEIGQRPRHLSITTTTLSREQPALAQARLHRFHAAGDRRIHDAVTYTHQ